MKIKINLIDFYKIHNKIESNYHIYNDKSIILNINPKYIDLLNENNIKFDCIESKLINVKLSFIIGYIMLFAFFLCNSLFITNIEFNKNTIINKEIEEIINLNSYNLFGVKILKSDLKKLNSDIRLKYINYEWISVYKKGSIIKVDINIKDYHLKDNNTIIPGDLIAKKDAYIYSYEIFMGKPLIKKNDFVKKDQILVSSNLLELEQNDSTNLVESRGIVLGKTVEVINYEIPKEIIKTEYSGRLVNFNQYYLFNKKINKSKSYNYENKEITHKKLFNFFNIFTKKNINIKEVNEFKIVYNINEAEELAIEYIKKQFNQNIVDAKESIKIVKTLKILEEEDRYIFSFLVEKIECISLFQRR